MDFEHTPAQGQLRAKIRTTPEQMMTSQHSATVSERINDRTETLCARGILGA